MPKFLSNIHFITSKSAVQSSDQNFIPQDLNEGSKGYFIYISKQFSSDPQQAISSIAFVQDKQQPPIGFTKLTQDLNQGAGGKFNYLCIQRGGSFKITDIIIKSFDKPIVKYEDSQAAQWLLFPQDLNTGTSKIGKFIYLFYKLSS